MQCEIIIISTVATEMASPSLLLTSSLWLCVWKRSGVTQLHTLRDDVMSKDIMSIGLSACLGLPQLI